MNIDSTVIRRLRELHRKSLAEMASMVGVSESHLFRIEAGQRSITDAFRHRFIAVLDLTPDKLRRLLAMYEDTRIT
ncbi:helix-turn-helix domain-containing protein [Paenibacillus sp. PL91]|uniref:helix-turn-helix domain-containing protein n=1 Tax=Paenibacillus sp. PL91 TaxID=2729538 RepID=UPI00145F2D97|nr:helix-turn-helix transcriptional regulator [Paenibacillus sp. PL91]MBC9199773.1 helix-turn-helix transcriptional regulator [Paenibacillus sp. PL91]